MKTTLIAFVAFIEGIAVTVMGGEPNQGWHQNFTAALRDAKSAELPLLLHFYTDWCGPCQQMEHSVLNTPEVLTQLGTVVVGAKINVDHQPEVAERFGVPAYPYDMLVTPEGEVLLSAGGWSTPSDYVARIRTAAARFAPQAKFANGSRPLHSGDAPGLDGYSPVSITLDRVWRKGCPKLAWGYEKVVYHFVDARELDLFRANPDRYAPKFRGRDPICLTAENRNEAGDIHYAAFYGDRLYLLSSSDNRRRFLASPERYGNPQDAHFVNEVAHSRE